MHTNKWNLKDYSNPINFRELAMKNLTHSKMMLKIYERDPYRKIELQLDKYKNEKLSTFKENHLNKKRTKIHELQHQQSNKTTPSITFETYRDQLYDLNNDNKQRSNLARTSLVSENVNRKKYL